jgi:hypothetical protein
MIEFNRVTIDFMNGSASINLNGINHIFTTVDNFIKLTGYPFNNTHMIFYEPERGIFSVERSGPQFINGKDVEEIVWIESNISRIIEAAHSDGYGEVYVFSLREVRNSKLYETDWMVTRHQEQLMSGEPASLSQEQYSNLLKYRQELRDITSRYNTLDDVVWPLFDL